MDKSPLLAHRIAWALMYGEFPDGQLDHINGEPSDNRITNLRLATESQNKANRRRSKRNSTGFKGVSFRKRDHIYSAQIRKDKKTMWLGSYKSPEEAHRAYAKAAKEMHGEFARLN